MDSMKNILIFGGTGFIGKALTNSICNSIPANGKIISLGSMDLDLTNRSATFDWFDRMHWSFECDHIFHLAALYKAGGWPISHPATQFHVNMSINVNLLEAWIRFFPKAKLTSALSYCMYPPHERPHPETELWGTEPEDYLYSYAITKKALLVGHKAYTQEYGGRCTAVILPTVYGPGDSFAIDSHVMGALIGKFVRAQINNKSTVEVWGDGNQEREFIYIDDAIDGITTVAANTEELVHNLGTGRTYSIKKIASIIKEISGFQGDIIFNTNRFVGVSKRSLDCQLIKKNLGWEARTSIYDGIKQTIQWYMKSLSHVEQG